MLLAMTREMVLWSVDFGIAVIFVGVLLCIARLVRGPHLADRALAVDTIAIHLVALVVLLTLRIRSLVLFDGVLVLSLLGFVGTIAVAQYLTRQHLSRQKRDLPPEADQ